MLRLIVVLLVLSLAACGSAPSKTSTSTVRAVDPGSEAARELPPEAKALAEQIQSGKAGAANPAEYHVGALDLLSVEVFQVPELTRKVRVNTSGSIGLPLVGSIRAEGMTVEQLEQEIARRLEKDYMQDPNVSVFIEEYVSQRITVEGAVATPGLFPMKGRTSLLQTIAMAGGTTDIANEAQIAVFRNTDKGRVVGMFDLRQIRAGTANDPEIRADDIIVVDKSGARSFLRRMIETMPLLTFGAILDMGHEREPQDRRASGLPVRALQPEGGALVERRFGTALSVDLREPEGGLDGETEGLDLRRLWAIVQKRKWTILAFLLIVLAGVATTTLLSTPIYRATATIQIDRDTLKVVDKGELETSNWGNEFYATQYALLRSRTLALRVAKDINAGANPIVQQMRQPKGWKALAAWWKGSTANVDPTTHTPKPEAARPAAPATGDPDKPYAGVIAAGLTIEPVRDSRLVRVSFDSPDANFSALVANAVVESFTRMTLERRSNASSYAKEFLEERLQSVRLKLEDSERQMIAYSQREQIVNVDDRRSLTEQTLQELTSALARAERDRMARESVFEQVRSTSGASMTQVLESPTVQKLKESRATLQAQYQEKLATFKPAFPLMQQLRGQIAEMDRQIAAETRDQRGAVEAEYRAGLAKERMMRARVKELEGEVLALQGRSIQYNILKRDVDTNRELYDGLLQRYKEVGVAGGVAANNVSVVDRAETGSKFKPDLQGNMLMALLFGLVGGVALAWLLEYLDDSIKSPEDVEQRLRMPILGIVPLLKSGTPLTALADTRSAFAESYRSVRTALQFSTSEGVPRVLFITSPAPTEGKTTTAYALAVNFAQLGKRVLLVDADLRNPSIHKLFGIANRKGLSNYLAGEAKSSEVMNATGTKGLIFVPTGPLPPNPAELLAGAKMAALLGLAGEKFDQVIIDGPPVLGLADALIVSNLATGTLLVVGSGATRVGYARGSIKRLLAARAHLLGVVLTKFESRTSSGYGYGYGYGYGEGTYYGGKALARS